MCIKKQRLQRLLKRSAKPLFVGSIPTRASIYFIEFSLVSINFRVDETFAFVPFRSC